MVNGITPSTQSKKSYKNYLVTVPKRTYKEFGKQKIHKFTVYNGGE